MFRIRTLPDSVAPANARAISDVQQIIRDQFPDMAVRDFEKIPDQISDPMAHQFVTRVMVAEDGRDHVRGFAMLLIDPALRFGYLELIAASSPGAGGGVGAALYEQVREKARSNKLEGVYFECLPDVSALSPHPDIRKQNAARLKFYEHFGAYPIIGTDYETPVEPETPDSLYLMFDGLGEFSLPKAARLRKIVRAILERKYADLCSPDYIDRVIKSINDKTLGLRLSQYSPKTLPKPSRTAVEKFPLVVNDKHEIHHIRERGYVEAPVRVSSILAQLEKTDLFERTEVKHFGDRYIKAVHDPRLVDYIERACADAPNGKSVYPYVFPIRNAQRMPKDRSVLAGYWCIDTFTPLNKNAYPAARGAADCALTAADAVLNGARAAYALVRPPGHHAETKAFGGFCYLNNAAIAAHYLSDYGRVAVLDVDYHHGNGTQEIFYERGDVLTVSIHGDPSFAYPYFTGFKDETGRGPGAGFNLNLPLGETIKPDDHRWALKRALNRIAEFKASYLVVAFGLDAAKDDPTGTWSYRATDFFKMGELIGGVDLATVFVQEGGYHVRSLGVNARRFFEGFSYGLAASDKTHTPKLRKRKEPSAAVLKWREAIRPDDLAEIRRLVIAANVFSPEEVAIAEKLAAERIARGRSAGYQFVFAHDGSRLAGYACYGRTPGTEKTFDLYWLVVDPARQRDGLGRALVQKVQATVMSRGGRYLIAETSFIAPYANARAFYDDARFERVAEIPDYYRPGDNKLFFRREIQNET